jgi:glycosyltransferase involved in cell wall biosynthesis
MNFLKTNKKILLISDEKYSELQNGGAESNNNELIKVLNREHKCEFITTFEFNIKFKEFTEIDLFILSNFYFISEEAKQFLYPKKYIITEHDYKFLQTRNPCYYENFLAPKSDIIHFELYKNAKFVLTQSGLQKSIFDKNLELSNIVNFSGNLWSEKTMDLIEALSRTPKNGKAAILGEDHYGIKGRDVSIDFCKKVHLKYELLPKTDHHTFLKNLSRYSTYVFFPRSPETLSRVCIEARLMGLSVVTTDYTAVVHESFFDYESNKMIEYIKSKPVEIFNLIKSAL